MKKVTTKDLKESLTLMLCRKQDDGAGGWRENWRNGPKLWASLWPIIGGDGYHEQDPGGPMASQCGYVHTLPPPRYRVVIRAGINLPPNSRFLWHLRQESKYLLLVNSPVFIQYHRFLSMVMVEEKKWENS
ncbi:MAG: hypothetical protein H0X26_09165 [Alphaproteobacteria bacterium]|nr:hypothetical protein [Alphaproteobacteria bacterium]